MKPLMMVALGTAGILVVWHREFIKRPKEVIVSSEGLVLRFRYGMRKKTVSWTEILGIGGFNEKESSFFHHKDGMGKLALSEDWHLVTNTIAIGIQAAYESANGAHPLEWRVHKDEKYSGFRRRAHGKE